MPGTLDDVCVSPTAHPSSPPSHQDSNSSREFKDFNGIRSWGSRNNNSRSSSALDRHSESSESLDNHSTCSANGGRQMQDFIGSSEYIPTRSTKTAPKVAYNPMQFVKTGPTKLAKTAQEQLKKAEEVKKVRETKKDDAEDWQSNLEGWKSSRRKRQEHVIERVTEVKRMEQEEALKASEAATKRLINIREKRGKLSALYSVEDNDEIEFNSNLDECGMAAISPDSSLFNGDQQRQENETSTVTPSDPGSYTYEKSIQDYVKFSTSVLQQESLFRMEEKEVVKRQEATKVDPQSPEATDRNKTMTDMVKRRSQQDVAVDKASITAANRRSGEFSSTFKNRLSTFELTEAAAKADATSRVTPDRDPQFKTKLATFHKVGETTTTVTPTTTTPPCVDESNNPNFKAKLAAFRQVEEKASAKVTPPAKLNKPAVAANKPVIPVAVKPTSILRTAPQNNVQQPEPIYANSSVAMAGSSSGHQRVVADAQSSFPSPPVADAESYSDCTEDEGIRSLSPHGTPSPTSPTPNEPPEPLPPPLPSHPPVGYSPYSFHNQREPEPADSPSSPTWPPANAEALVWDDWVVDLGAAAPPSEKPPPPPISNPPTETTTTSTPCTSTTSTTFTSINQQIRNKETTEPAGLRQELRKRRSDFLGFDVNAMEDDAKELADAIPPPPDLKTLLRHSATDYKVAEWPEEELARKEREIIETLEKEENERSASHNRSQDGIEYEMTAEIDQLAREWQTGSSIRRTSTKLQPETEVKQQLLHVEVNNRPQQQQPLQSILVSPSAAAVKQVSPQLSQLSPPKPSRLSAAPKPKLHDGEAWMAKRKVASEGGTVAAGRKDMKDVSRHWLIQEAEQRRIDAMQERQRNYSPLSSSSSLQLTPPVRPIAAAPPPAADGNHWMSRSSSSTSMDKMSELRLPNSKGGMDHSFRSTSSLGSSPTPRPLYANQEEILEYADFTGAPHTAPPVWQVRSLVSSGSMDQLQSIHNLGSIQSPPSRPAKSQSQTLPSSSSTSSMQQFSGNAAQTQPSWRSTHPPGEIEKETIAPLPHSVITTLTQRMTQRNNNNNANYGDYMNVQEATQSRAGPQVPAQRPANYRHPSVVGPSHSAPVQSSSHQNNNDRMLSVSGKKKCSLCQEELGRGAAMIIESLRLFYHINCFRCCVCGIALGNGTAGTDVRVRNNNLHCHDCYSNDDGLKFSKV